MLLLEFELLCMIHTYSHHDLRSKLAGMIGLSGLSPQAVNHGKSHEMLLNHH